MGPNRQTMRQGNRQGICGVMGQGSALKPEKGGDGQRHTLFARRPASRHGPLDFGRSDFFDRNFMTRHRREKRASGLTQLDGCGGIHTMKRPLNDTDIWAKIFQKSKQSIMQKPEANMDGL